MSEWLSKWKSEWASEWVNEPWSRIQLRKEDGVERHVGFLIDIWEEIAAKNGYNFRYYKTPDNQYGSRVKNSSNWTGMHKSPDTTLTQLE